MKKQIAFSIIILIGLLFFGLKTHGQTSGPRIFITWTASNYAPPDFSGKILPTRNSQITASAILINNNQLVDLSRKTARWYLNGDLLTSGVGLKTITYRNPDQPGSAQALRVELPDYQNGQILETVSIPVVAPEAVIDAPFPNQQFSQPSIRLTARPFFFNPSPDKLNISWRVNDQAPTNLIEPQFLDIKFQTAPPTSFNLSINLDIKNPYEELEMAARALNLTYSL